MNKPYEPVACALHDKYEIAIMHKKHINIKWLDDNGDFQTDKVLPKDILVKNKEEFLLATLQNNEQICIRLDKAILLE